MYSMYEPHVARELLGNAHSAVADVDNLLNLLRAICEALKPQSWRELWQMSEEARIPKYMPFGKYAPKKTGEPILIVDLPDDYRRWCLKQSDMDPYVLMAVKRSFGLS